MISYIHHKGYIAKLSLQVLLKSAKHKKRGYYRVNFTKYIFAWPQNDIIFQLNISTCPQLKLCCSKRLFPPVAALFVRWSFLTLTSAVKS